MTTFLSAKWTNLIVISYAVSDATLASYLPAGMALDRWEGKAYASIVAFDFSDTRIQGRSVPNLPNLRTFPELNLRFYVRQGDKQGVVFVREIVPNPLVASLARLWYNEPYVAAPLTRSVQLNGPQGRTERHTLRWRGTEQHIAVALPQAEPQEPNEGEFGAWVTQRPWGFGTGRGGRPTRFHVYHPLWRTLPVEGCEITLDFAALYGAHWTFLQNRAPDSVLFAEGSPVTVSGNEPAGPRGKQQKELR